MIDLTVDLTLILNKNKRRNENVLLTFLTRKKKIKEVTVTRPAGAITRSLKKRGGGGMYS